MRRTLAAACTAASLGTGFAGAAPASADPVVCLVVRVYEPVLQTEWTTSTLCWGNQPGSTFCEKSHTRAGGLNPTNPNDPTALHTWTTVCVLHPVT